MSARTVRYHHMVLYEALEHAVKHGLLIRNVAEAVDPPTPGPREIAILDSDRVRTLLQAAEGTRYLVFSHPGGRPLRPNTVPRAFERLAKSLGFKGIRFYDLRYAHATLMLRQGIHPEIVSERLGHSSVAITLDIYSHVLSGLQEAAARKFEEGLQDTSVQIPEAGAP